jgi:hypothetical protein
MPSDWIPEGGMQVRRLDGQLLRVWLGLEDPEAPWVWEIFEIEAETEELEEIECGCAATLEEAEAAAEAAVRQIQAP